MIPIIGHKNHLALQRMEYIFLDRKIFLVNQHYYFLQGILIVKLMRSNADPEKTCFKLYTKYTEKVHGTKLYHQNHILISLCVTEFICSLSPDKSERHARFQYADGKMIIHLKECKLEDNKVFHINLELLNENIDNFIKNSPNWHGRYPTWRNRVQWER